MTLSITGHETLATPEGDGDFDSAQPLTPGAVESSIAGLQTPPGNAPAGYAADRPSELGEELTEIIEAIDKVSRGKLVP